MIECDCSRNNLYVEWKLFQTEKSILFHVFFKGDWHLDDWYVVVDG